MLNPRRKKSGLGLLRPFFRLPEHSAVLCILAFPVQAELYFPPSLIADKAVADLSHFERQGAQLPGIYPVEIWLNGEQVFSKSLRFVPADDQGAHKAKTHAVTTTETAPQKGEVRDTTGLKACLTRKDLIALRVNLEAFPTPLQVGEETCLSPGAFIPQAWTAFDFRKMRLDVSIPQVALHNHARGDIPPELWDEGINAAMLNYNFSSSNNYSHSGDSRSYFLSLDGGVNLGPWRLRDRRNWSSYSSSFHSYQRWQRGTTTLSRAIVPWRSELTLGESTSDGNVFDSFGFRGARLASEDAMLPDSMQGYAPIIRGTAGSNARVSVRQNGYEVYQTTVAAGEFAISDLHPMYASGDLTVTVTEADGSTRNFSVPYSSVPVLVREGRSRYELTAGTFRTSGEGYASPGVVQATLVHGLPHGLTVYGGVQKAERYHALALGAGLNMGVLGALSADITQADSTLSDSSRHRGQSLRFLYARSLNALGTTLQLTGYRYSTRGFYTLSEAALKGMSGWLHDSDELDEQGKPLPRPAVDYYSLYDSKRQRLQISLSQRLGDIGSLYLTASQQSFWNQDGVSRSLQAGFSSSLGPVNYNLSLSHNRTAGFAGTDRAAYLSASLPLGQWLPGGSSPIYASFSGSRNSHGGITQQAGLSGSLLSEHNLDWNLTQGSDASSSGRVDYRGSYANTSLGYSHNHSYSQLSYSAAGGIVLHGDGLTLSQPLGDTNILVAAPGAAGVALENGTGIHTDWRGYSVRPWASGYRENRVALDPGTLDDHTEIDSAVARVVPTRGALVRANFKTRSGTRALLTLTHNGEPLPFGALVSNGDNSGIVSDDGQVYLAGLSPEGELTAQWGEGADQQCKVTYRIAAGERNAPLAKVQAACR